MHLAHKTASAGSVASRRCQVIVRAEAAVPRRDMLAGALALVGAATIAAAGSALAPPAQARDYKAALAE